MNCKLKLKLGDLEVEFDGSEDFVRKDLVKLAQDFSKTGVPVASARPSNGKPQSATTNGPLDQTLTTTAIAKKLSCKTLQDLIQSAVAYLALVRGQESFSKDEIWENMKAATGYFDAKMSKNYSREIGKMVKADFLREVAKDRFSLASEHVTALQTRIA